MASNQETGHAVNISNFKLLIDKCTAFGAAFNPSNPDLTIGGMTTLWTACSNAHDTITKAFQQAKIPVNQRQQLFEPVDKLVTRSLNYFNSTKAGALIKADAKGLADRFRGFGKKEAKPVDGKPDPNAISTSHQSFVQKADALKQLIDLLESDGDYAPNETELTLTSLKALYGQMKAGNDAIGSILSPVEVNRLVRNKALYGADTGMIDVALTCKKYVKGLYGAGAPETSMVSGIKFTRPKS